MFVDTAKIYVKAGDGGDGAVSFHREKYVSAGGPDGGDGGSGGDIVFTADDSASTLVEFKYKKKFTAENGQKGGGSKCFGKAAPSLRIAVPRGTVIRDFETGAVIHDMSDGQDFIIFRGGRGGWGNARFATPTRQTPRFAKRGELGQGRMLMLELKLIADVGLIGFPNAGKSTFLSAVSAAKPKIAGYPFTTLEPQLGVVTPFEGASFVVADIPGLIEGAAEGRGLGHEFLRHVERCRLLIHLVDIAGVDGRDPVDDYKKINAELERFSARLAGLPQAVCANKADIGYDTQALERLTQAVGQDGRELFVISAATGDGLKEVVKNVYTALSKLPKPPVYEPEIDLEALAAARKEDRGVNIKIEDGIYFVEAAWILETLGNTDPGDVESLNYMNKVLKGAGVYERLEEAGIKEGDTVDIYGLRFEYIK